MFYRVQSIMVWRSAGGQSLSVAVEMSHDLLISWQTRTQRVPSPLSDTYPLTNFHFLITPQSHKSSFTDQKHPNHPTSSYEYPKEALLGCQLAFAYFLSIFLSDTFISLSLTVLWPLYFQVIYFCINEFILNVFSFR